MLPHATSADGERYLSADVTTEKWWLTGCRGKRAYDSERIALREAVVHEAKRRIPLRTYRCSFCHRWHLTTDHERSRLMQDELGMIIWRLENHLRERGVIP